MRIATSLSAVLALILSGCSTLVAPPALDDDLPGGADDGEDSAGVDEPADTFEPTDTFAFDDDSGGGGTGGNPNVDPDLQNCSPVSATFSPEDPQGVVGFVPAEISVSVLSFADSNGMSDLTLPDGTDLSGYVLFQLYDDLGTEVCGVLFDVSGATVVTPSTVAADAWAGWQIPLIAADARAVQVSNGSVSLCPPLDASFADSFGGVTDPGTFLANEFGPVTVGVGPLSGQHATVVQDLISGTAGLDWANDFEPYVVAMHLAYGNDPAQPYGIARRYDSECALIKTVDPSDTESDWVQEPKPTSAWPGGVTEMIGIYVVTFSQTP